MSTPELSRSDKYGNDAGRPLSARLYSDDMALAVWLLGVLCSICWRQHTFGRTGVTMIITRRTASSFAVTYTHSSIWI